jgi:asparagine synthase (glutamine-hydrolysing)
MCGITGYAYFDKERRIEPGTLRNMTDSIRHRGPDDEGFFIDNNIGLGFRRLSIIDLSTGHQPLANEDETVWIIFNGEIYNYQALQENLIKQGHVFKTKSDTETIVHLYEQYGTDCLQYLRGMFGFAIWDSRKQQLFCARDRFGIKPLYYYTDNEKIVFGSEIKAILKADNVDKTLSYDALDSYFAFGYITSDLSIYKNVRKLQPGHYLLISFGGKPAVETRSFWEIHFDPDYSKTENQWSEEIEACLSETVKLHMISDVPLGAFLSGGIDSSSVVAMMARNSTRPIKTFSIGFKEQKFDELKYAVEIAKKYNCEHHEQVVEPESIGLLPKLVSAYDEPYADSSAIPTYYVSKMARENVTVALSGDGGDELFAGYDIYARYKQIHSFPLNFNSAGYNKLLWGNIHKLIPESAKGKNFSYYLSQDKRYLGSGSTFWTKPQRQRFILNNHPAINYANASELFKEEILKKSTTSDCITNLQYLDLRTYMVDDILTKVDRASMLNSLEVRVPLLDHKFAELSFKIPWNLKFKQGVRKYIFKQSMAPYLPENILKHPKQGFGVPLSVWFKDNLKTYVSDTFNSQDCPAYTFLDKKFVKKTISNGENGNWLRRNFSEKIWALLFFNEWLRQSQ